MKNKIYTKTGDKGETGYLGGRIAKDSSVINVIGELDELNASIGICISLHVGFESQLLRVQAELFSIGAIFADFTDVQKINYPLANWIKTIEIEIDAMELELNPLQNFILPGGSMLSAQLHLSRSICPPGGETNCSLHQTAFSTQTDGITALHQPSIRLAICQFSLRK